VLVEREAGERPRRCAIRGLVKLVPLELGDAALLDESLQAAGQLVLRHHELHPTVNVIQNADQILRARSRSAANCLENVVIELHKTRDAA
jgi:hypothetical protein